MSSNIQVEITDATELHCFKLTLNPQGHEPQCEAAMMPDAPCSCAAQGVGLRMEIMFHARSLVDLIHKCSEALCDWQNQTTEHLIRQTTDYLNAQLGWNAMRISVSSEAEPPLVCRECGRAFGHETP